MSNSYAWEKLYDAVLILAKGTIPLRDRLQDAYISSLMRLRPAHHFPDVDTRERFVGLMDELAPNGRIDVALATWPDQDLQRIVEDLVGLYTTISRRVGES